MSCVLKKIEKDGVKVIVGVDEHAINPREEYDNLFELILTNTWHYTLGDTQDIDFSEFFWQLYVREYGKEPRSSRTAFLQLNRDYVIHPVYMYSHSGIALSVTDFNDRWDSGQLGYAVCSKKRLREELKLKSIKKNGRALALDVLKGELKTYEKYLNGEVYFFSVECENETEYNDSCGGFYDMESMYDHVPDRIRPLLKELIASL